MIIYEEPDEHGECVQRRLTIAEAVARQKVAAADRGKFYATDEEALQDFLVIHYAWEDGDA